MKMPNVYVGQLADIRHGAVYSNITEAVKEVCRAQQPGMVICFIYLPESPTGKYWIAGAVGPAANTKWNLIFTNSSDAEKHVDLISARGFSRSELVCKELKINTKGPNVVDIKTEEHFACERELSTIKSAIENGLPVDNSSNRMPLELFENGFNRPATFGIFNLSAPAWTQPESYILAMGFIREAAKLLAEFAIVDPDTQPRKWARLQESAATFAGEHQSDEGADDSAS